MVTPTAERPVMMKGGTGGDKRRRSLGQRPSRDGFWYLTPYFLFDGVSADVNTDSLKVHRICVEFKKMRKDKW